MTLSHRFLLSTIYIFGVPFPSIVSLLTQRGPRQEPAIASQEGHSLIKKPGYRVAWKKLLVMA